MSEERSRIRGSDLAWIAMGQVGHDADPDEVRAWAKKWFPKERRLTDGNIQTALEYHDRRSSDEGLPSREQVMREWLRQFVSSPDGRRLLRDYLENEQAPYRDEIAGGAKALRCRVSLIVELVSIPRVLSSECEYID